MTGFAWAFMIVVWSLIFGCSIMALNKIINHGR